MKSRSLSLILFAAAMTIVILVHIMNYRQSKFLLESFTAVEESQHTLIKINKLSSYLRDIQRSYRGFALTGQNEFLQPYRNAVQMVPILIDELRGELASQPVQIALVDSLERKAEQKVDFIEDAIVQITTGNRRFATENIPYGTTLFEQMNDLLDAIEENERLLVMRHHQTVQERARINSFIIITGLLSSTFLMSAAIVIIFKSQKKIERLNMKVEDSNTKLYTINSQFNAINT